MDESEYISLSVRNPRTHLRKGWPQFTDYEIHLQSNSSVFVRQESSVRRRYSEFEWLRRMLEKNNSITIHPPRLPAKKLLGRFNKEFIKKRQQLLQDFLVRCVSVTSYLSEAGLHLFLQTSLSITNMERILDGRDTRDVTDIIMQGGRERKKSAGLKREVLQPCTEIKKEERKGSRDSGFSGSMRCGLFLSDGREDSCSSFQGNGWSSGVTESTLNGSAHQCQTQDSRLQVASVLPTGQLVTALVSGFGLISQPTHTTCRSDSESSLNCEEEQCRRCNFYDADDETDNDILGYDIINTSKMRVRKWLNSIPMPEGFVALESTSEEDAFEGNLTCISERDGVISDDCVTADVFVPEYDVISVACCQQKPLSRFLSQTTGYQSGQDTSSKDDDSEGSMYSFVHSDIGGLELEKDKPTQESEAPLRKISTVSSAAIFRTYDVVEMIEVTN